jgi:hypothetical protein
MAPVAGHVLRNVMVPAMLPVDAPVLSSPHDATLINSATRHNTPALHARNLVIIAPRR